jgi:hypothetical protein
MVDQDFTPAGPFSGRSYPFSVVALAGVLNGD